MRREVASRPVEITVPAAPIATSRPGIAYDDRQGALRHKRHNVPLSRPLSSVARITSWTTRYINGAMYDSTFALAWGATGVL